MKLLLLLLVSLLASDPRPLGDEALVTDYCRRHVAPRALQTHMVHCCFIQGKRRDQGHCSSHRAVTGIIRCRRSPTTIVFLLLKEGKRFPEFLASDTLPGSCCISGDTSTVKKVKKCPDSLPRPSAAQAFLLEKPSGGATATTAPIVTISCCLKEGEAKSAITTRKICSRRVAGPQTGQRDDGQQARDVAVQYFRQDDGQHPTAAAVNQWEFGASAPNSGRSSMKTSHLSELETQRNAAGRVKTNERLNLDDEPSLQKSPREQLFIKSASRVDDDDDGFYGNGQILVSREKKEATVRQLYNLRPARDNNKELNKKKITQRAQLRPPEGEGEKLGSRLNTIKHGNEKTSANVLKLGLAEEEAGGLITVFLPDTQMETQTDPASARTLIPSTDTGREAAEAASGRPPVVLFQEIKYVLLEMNVIENTLVKDIKPAKSFTETVEEVKETTENAEANSAAHANMRINHIKQESVISASPLVKIFQTETMKADQAAEATAANMDRKEPTSRMDAFNQSSRRKAEGLPRTDETSTGTSSPEPGTDSEPRCVKCETRRAPSRTGESPAGLRMREDVLAALSKLRGSRAENADEAPTNGPGSGRREDDPGGNALERPKPSETGHGRAPASDEPACRGLIHRTAAGWKHCVERLAGAATRQPEPEGREGPPTGDPEGRPPGADEQERFYYFDGELRRVQGHFYPRSKRRRGDVPAASGQRTPRGNLLSYVQRLVSKNKPSGRR